MEQKRNSRNKNNVTNGLSCHPDVSVIIEYTQSNYYFTIQSCHSSKSTHFKITAEYNVVYTRYNIITKKNTDKIT